MSDISRRQILGVAAAAIMVPPTVEAQEVAPSGPSRTPSFRFRLAEAPAEQYSGGTLRKVVREQFPSSPSMSGGIITLDPGGMREPHWHPNAIEWDYVVAGRFRFNITDASGNSETFEASAGDIVVVPQGYAHYFENVGDQPAVLVLTFNHGHFDEIGISEWVAKTPRGVFEVPLNLPQEALSHAPDHRLFVTSRKTPGQ